ncbi:MAG: glycerol-3-phosphate acyltransferase [Clostridia bacterium]|nr:glycerol-3-phosphate acyltransferase [Clostridia bacterium]
MKEFLFSEQWYILLIMAIISYLLGGFSGAVLISKRVKHEDIREKGSGNPGTMNMARAYGFKFGLFTFIVDMLKGAIASLVGLLVYKDYCLNGINAGEFVCYINGLCVVVGHIYPALKKFKGGKGIATTCGVFTVGLVSQSWWFLLIIPICYVLTLALIYVIEYASLSSLIIVSVFGITQLVLYYVAYNAKFSVALGFLYAFVFLICALDWFAHRANVKRLLAGEEHKTSLKSMLKKKKK